MERWLRAQRKVSVLQKGASCSRNTQQRVSVSLAIVGVSIRIWQQHFGTVGSVVHHLERVKSSPSLWHQAPPWDHHCGQGLRSAWRGELGSDTAQGRAMSGVRAGTRGAPR